ncbi:unnamed protein product [Rangifer tarandus platyrhynchus]|uniref:Uncharacterized protein n=1 Tax=Rangifer tarandus platyrhynchus TaxID=3082113 RepID=A0AC59YM18_RANTA
MDLGPLNIFHCQLYDVKRCKRRYWRDTAGGKGFASWFRCAHLADFCGTCPGPVAIAQAASSTPLLQGASSSKARLLWSGQEHSDSHHLWTVLLHCFRAGTVADYGDLTLATPPAPSPTTARVPAHPDERVTCVHVKSNSPTKASGPTRCVRRLPQKDTPLRPPRVTPALNLTETGKAKQNEKAEE